MVSEALKVLLKSRATSERISGMQRLARMAATDADTDIVPLLLAGLLDKNSYVAALAAEALGECADLEAVGVMMEQFRRLSRDGLKLDPGCHIRAHLAFAFGRLESLHADDVLRIGIRTVQLEPVGGVEFDTAGHLRANCALAMAQIRAPDALRDIALLLFDDGKGMFERKDGRDVVGVEPRKAAARSLAILGTAEARVPLTLRLLHAVDEAPDVLQQCMQSLVDLEDPDAPDLLKRIIADKTDSELTVFAGLMLARARADGAELALRGLVARYSGDAMRAAILALASLRTQEAVKHLKELAVDDRKVVRDAMKELDLGN